jgi:lysozyme
MSDVSPGMQLCMDSEGYAKDRGDGWVIAYLDSAALVWTIGFGSTGNDIKKGTTWTRDHAVLRLQQGWDNAKAGALRASPILTKYPLMLEAVTDFCYNCGVGAYQASTLRRKVNALDWPGAADEFPKWNHSRGKVITGLTVRRQKERALFLSQIADATNPDAKPDQSAPVAVPPDDPSPIASTDSTTESQTPDVWPILRKRIGGWLRALADRLQ